MNIRTLLHFKWCVNYISLLIVRNKLLQPLAKTRDNIFQIMQAGFHRVLNSIAASFMQSLTFACSSLLPHPACSYFNNTENLSPGSASQKASVRSCSEVPPSYSSSSTEQKTRQLNSPISGTL